MIYAHIKKIREKLANSLVFLVSATFVLGFVCAMLVLIQVPNYVAMVQQKKYNNQRAELTAQLEDLEQNYHDNSRAIYDAYLESPFHNWRDLDKIPIQLYTDEDIRVYAMNQYFDKYLREELLSNDEAEFSTEISTFIRVFDDRLDKDEQLVKLMEERVVLQNAIKDMMQQISEVPVIKNSEIE